MQGLKYVATDFLISTREKIMLRHYQSRPGKVKQRFWRFFVHFWSEVKNSVTTYFALGHVKAVYQVLAQLTKL